MSDTTPLYDTLTKRADLNKLRFHMPGHKGRDILNSPLAGAMRLDFTELYGTGNLYDGVPPISNAEALAAKAWNAAQAFFLTGGASQGIFAAVYTAMRGKKKIIIDRGCHKSVYHALALLDLEPIYLCSKRVLPFQISGSAEPDALIKLLTENPDAGAVVLTCPTYYGILSDIEKISYITRSFGVYLIVDEAHGAHLPFHEGYAGAVSRGADIAVCSMHKTLPALGQAAMLTANDGFSAEAVRRATAIFGTSSPSYNIMASMDITRRFMDTQGRTKSGLLAKKAAEIRGQINSRGIFRALNQPDLDPLRLCVHTACAGLSGYRGARILEDELGVVCEMADAGNILFIITVADELSDLERLSDALCKLEEFSTVTGFSLPDMPPAGCAAVSPHEALLSETEDVPIKQSIGRVAAHNLCPYPPGIPVVALGEVINSEHLEYLFYQGFTEDDTVTVTNK